MELFKDRRALALAGTGLALLAGLAIAAFLMLRDRGASEPPPASQGGLVVQTGRDDDVRLDEGRPLRCFVNGQLVGDLKLSECAKRNGVASGALDVGLDPTGALAAANGTSSQITPLPPGEASSGVAPPASASAAAESPAAPPGAVPFGGQVAACWLYADAAWSRIPEDLTLAACVRTLYPERCGEGGPPIYGRWADRTLRLLDGRVEISPDNRRFHVLAGRGPDCEGERPPE
ncbi:MAG TPA: hypothetical protein VKQ54_04475 [Caulobacteraceae bacterium]|nr:hypothetical protein [Caulobacteraceae bacterium]